MTQRLRRVPGGFGVAFRGWWLLVRTTPNAWVHLTAAVLALALGVALGVPAAEMASVVLAIGLVLTAELMNSALEAAIDLETRDRHPLAGAAKDLAAGGVLLAAATSIVVGVLVFGPRLLRLL